MRMHARSFLDTTTAILNMAEYRPAEKDSPQLRFSPSSTYHSSFFLVRTGLSISEQPAEIERSSGELTLCCRSPRLSIPFPSIYSEVEDTLKKHGVGRVSNFFCEDAPLFQVRFDSEYNLTKFLRLRSKVQNELTSLFSATISELQAKTSPDFPSQPVPVAVHIEIFLISPEQLTRDARVVNVTLGNCSTCMTLWKESELFDFGSLFQVYRHDPSKLPQGGMYLGIPA